MNKEDRVRSAVSAAVREPARARDLVDGLLAEYRAFGFFTTKDDASAEHARKLTVSAARSAFARVDWELTESGELRPAGVGSVIAVEGRPAIEDQLKRLRRAAEDPALMIGTSKEMLESTAKYVLEAFSVPYTLATDFDELWFHARDRLGLHPKNVDVGVLALIIHVNVGSRLLGLPVGLICGLGVVGVRAEAARGGFWPWFGCGDVVGGVWGAAEPARGCGHR